MSAWCTVVRCSQSVVGNKGWGGGGGDTGTSAGDTPRYCDDDNKSDFSLLFRLVVLMLNRLCAQTAADHVPISVWFGSTLCPCQKVLFPKFILENDTESHVCDGCVAGILWQVSSFQHSFNCQLIMFPFELNMRKVNTSSVIIHVHFAC